RKNHARDLHRQFQLLANRLAKSTWLQQRIALLRHKVTPLRIAASSSPRWICLTPRSPAGSIVRLTSNYTKLLETLHDGRDVLERLLAPDEVNAGKRLEPLAQALLDVRPIREQGGGRFAGQVHRRRQHVPRLHAEGSDSILEARVRCVWFRFLPQRPL